MKLRNYQQAAEDKTFQVWESGVRSVIGQMATGLGKTIIFSSIIKRMGKRAMILAHRKELIFQAVEKLEFVTGIKADIEMGEHKSSTDGDLFKPKSSVICSTIQTHSVGGDGGGRMTKFDPMDFGLLIIDECHRSAAPSYRKVIDYYLQNPDLVVLGVTATSDRSDKQSLGQVFEDVAFDYDIQFGIKDGWLVPVPQLFVSVDSMDISQVGTSAGELNGAELAAVLQAEKPIQEMIEAIFEIMHGLPEKSLYEFPANQWAEKVMGIKPKRAIAFTRFVHHAEMLSNILNRISSGFSNWICGKTEDGDRTKIIGDFKKDSGASIICNANVLTEGYDDNGVEIVFMCAPLKSRIRYAQQAGRGTRPHASIANKLNDCPAASIRRSMIARSPKPKCLIIDFVGNSGKHKLVSMVDILAGDASDEVIELVKQSIRKSGRPTIVEKAIEEEEKRIEEKKARELDEQARKAKVVFKASYKTQTIDPFDVFQIKPAQPRGWDTGKELSQKMRGLLQKAGFNPDELDYAKAKQLCGVMIDRWSKHLCSVKQAALLKRYSHSPDMTFDEAKKTIDAIAANGWKRVEPVFSTLPKRREKVAVDFEDNCSF